MPTADAKTHKLTVLLIKDSVKSFNAALRDPNALTRIAIKKGATVEGEFWHANLQFRTPSWQRFVQPVLGSKLGALNTASVAAVLFVTTRNRIFAFTFGYGRNLLKPDSYELGFGLRVALNRIDHRQIRSLDHRAYEDLVLSTRKQTSRSSELGSFGLDVSRDLLRAVTGVPSDPSFGKRLTGTDSLTLNVPISAEELTWKCEELLDAYQEDAYKKHFGWIDHLSQVRDKKVIQGLNDDLLRALRSGSTGKLHLAAPEPLEWETVEAFRIGGTRHTEYDDLDIDDYLVALGDKKGDLTLDILKSSRIAVRYTGNDSFQYEWSLYDCVVWETTQEGRLYALVEGKWLEIEQSFAVRVRDFVKKIPSPTKKLPHAVFGEREEEYNRRVAEADSSRLICLDRELVKPEDAASPIELCDLLSIEKQFIHVKKKSRSATLSHLFAQGTVAARAFLGDGSVRKRVHEILEKKGKKTDEWLSVIPGETTRPIASEYEVVYAVIIKPNGEWPSSLPFFSQLNLMQHAKLLHELGYRVLLDQIVEARLDEMAR